MKQNSDIVIRYVRTKNKTRKLTTYISDECELHRQHEIINSFLLERFMPSIFTKGYVKGCSIYHNALAHLYNDYFVMIDIKDFFPHICHKQLADKLFYEINLRDSNQINMAECKRIVDLCSVSSRGLPLGFITSPLLSNIYMKEFDNIFYGKLKHLDLDHVIYTRYADDIIVSFRWNSNNDPEQKEEIVSIASHWLSKYGLQINNNKTRFYNLNLSNHVRITGVNITKDKSNYRRLTVGRSAKNVLFWRAIACIQSGDATEKEKLKGLQSFILSIEKEGYESCYSSSMHELVHSYGYSSLKELIDSF